MLKVPHSSIAGDIAAFNGYRREIEIFCRLDHPGLQRLLSDAWPFGVVEAVWCLVALRRWRHRVLTERG